MAILITLPVVKWIFVLRDMQIHFPTGSVMSVAIPAVPQAGKCVFDTAYEVVVTVNVPLSFRPVQLNWLEVRAVGWLTEDLTAIILN